MGTGKRKVRKRRKVKRRSEGGVAAAGEAIVAVTVTLLKRKRLQKEIWKSCEGKGWRENELRDRRLTGLCLENARKTRKRKRRRKKKRKSRGTAVNSILT